MGFWTALLAILSFFYDLPYMHAVLWITLDILIFFRAGVAASHAASAGTGEPHYRQSGVNKYSVQ